MNAKLIISIGSNCDQVNKVSAAKKQLIRLFGADVTFTKAVWTTPVDIKSDRFLNSLCFTITDMSLENVKKTLKNLEFQLGSTQEERSQNIVKIDLDILQYADTLMHEADWQRCYVKKLIKECPFT